jgi:hypothetical protein
MRSDVRHAKVHLYIALIDVCLEDETPSVHIMDACASRIGNDIVIGSCVRIPDHGNHWRVADS